MKMTNAEMGEYIDVMSNCHETGKLGFAIAKNLRKMKDEAKEYTDLRAELLRKYGTLSEDEKSITVSGENFKKYNDEMGDIPAIASDVDIYKVDENTFYSGHLTSGQMMQMLWMVEDEDDGKDGE